MKLKTFAAYVALCGLMVPMFGYAADPESGKSESGMSSSKDSQITSKVKIRLANDRMATLAGVHVETVENGEVHLSGVVKSERDADRAVELAKKTEGVKSVKSEIRVKSE